MTFDPVTHTFVLTWTQNKDNDFDCYDAAYLVGTEAPGPTDNRVARITQQTQTTVTVGEIVLPGALVYTFRIYVRDLGAHVAGSNYGGVPGIGRNPRSRWPRSGSGSLRGHDPTIQTREEWQGGATEYTCQAT